MCQGSGGIGVAWTKNGSVGHQALTTGTQAAVLCLVAACIQSATMGKVAV